MSETASKETAETLVLASGSPRRRDLLEREGIAFEVRPADIEEEVREDESPADLVRRLSFEKASAVALRLGDEVSRWVLGADTIVVIDGDVLGKPRDAAHAEALLARITGRTHEVVTGFAFVSTRAPEDRAKSHVDLRTSRVSMREATSEEIAQYVAGGEPMDKAGAYAVQGEGRRFVTRVEGCQDNVIGLPVDEVARVWARLRDEMDERES